MINGATQIALTKLDILYPECAGVNSYSDLSPDAKNFVERIEEEISLPASLIGTGPEVQEIIDRR